MKSKIIVTGGCGYIGSHTVIELIENNYEVVILDDLSNSTEETLNRIQKITGTKPTFINLDLKERIKSFGLYYHNCINDDSDSEITIEGNSQTQYYKDKSCKDGEWKFYNPKGELIETKFFTLGEEVKLTE